jgi:ankyrin repeat protein
MYTINKGQHFASIPALFFPGNKTAKVSITVFFRRIPMNYDSFFYSFFSREFNKKIDNAIQSCDLATIKNLIKEESCANKEQRFYKDGLSEFLYRCIDLSAPISVFKCFIDLGANINSLDMFDRTPLFYAIRKMNGDAMKETVSFLVESGADVNITNDEEKTPLMEAADCGELELMEILLEHGAAVDSIDEYGNNVLFYARRTEAAEMLISAGVDVNFVNEDYFEEEDYFKDNVGVTPLMNAFEEGNNSVAEVFLNHGARTDIIDKNGKTALMTAIEKSYCDSEMIQKLIDKGADVNAVDNNGDSVLIQAVKAIHKRCKKDWKDFLKYDLRFVSEYSNEFILEILRTIVQSSKLAPEMINKPDKNGITPLGYAVKSKRSCLVEILLSAGADAQKWNPKSRFSGCIFLKNYWDIDNAVLNFTSLLIKEKLNGNTNENTPEKQKKIMVDILKSLGNKKFSPSNKSMFALATAIVQYPEKPSAELMKFLYPVDSSSVEDLVRIFAENFVPDYISPEAVLGAISHGRRRMLGIMDTDMTQHLVDFMIETLETNPKVVVDFLNKRIGKEFADWKEYALENLDILTSRLAACLSKSRGVKKEADIEIGFPEF